MKNAAFGLVMVILLSFLVEPMGEIACLMRDKVTLSTAISNSCRSAKDRSLEADKMRDLKAVINQQKFIDYFADTFCKIMNFEIISKDSSRVEFSSKDGKYNNFIVTIKVDNSIDASDQEISTIAIHAESIYIFKTKYLKLAEKVSPSLSYKLLADRSFTMSVKN
jgi:hypothetical protein